MTKEKIVSLTKYQAQLKDKLTSTVVPVKHTNRVSEYRQFLQHELATVTNKLEEAKLEGGK